MNQFTTLIAAALAAVAFGVSAQTAPVAADHTTDAFTGGATSTVFAHANSERAAVEAEYVRARNAGEISPLDNHAEPFALTDLRQARQAQRQDVHAH